MKIVIAPQSFKESVSALVAAKAIQRGVLAVAPEAETVLAPVADGGNGTLDVLVDGTGGQRFKHAVTSPLGWPEEAAWGVMGDGRTVVVEAAQASGLALVPPSRRDPRITTSRGTGQIIAEALNRGFSRLIVCLGGTATNDGGAGMAEALGVRFLDEDGRSIPEGGAGLARLAAIDASRLHRGLAGATVIGAVDVTNPLCGPAGASAVYGPQKGASPKTAAELDSALLNFAQVVHRDLGMDVAEMPGSGAGGGLGAGLIAFAGARLTPGIDMMCEVLGFDAILEGADLVITGEGRVDRSTIYNKAPVGVARRAQNHNAPTLLLAGKLGPGYEELYDHGISGIVCIADGPMSTVRSLTRAEELLEAAAQNTMRLLMLRGFSG